MINQDIDVEALKNDKEFLKSLEKLESDMRESNSILKGYELLNAKLLLEEDEETISEIFTFIVERAFDRFNRQIELKKPFNIHDKEDLATLRAVYEFAMQNYVEENYKDASELFLILSLLSSGSELFDIFLIHFGALKSGYNFDDFIKKLAIIPDDKLKREGYEAHFITDFNQPIDIMLKMFEREIKIGLDSLDLSES